MPEVIINGPAGRLECKYSPGQDANAPTALILHPEPDKNGTMNNRVSFNTYKLFEKRGYSVMRFNFRGVGRSQGVYDAGEGELADAATAMDWLQSQHPTSNVSWIAGFSFGSWIGMQLMMRRPEIKGFVSLSPPASTHDFSFLAPCPASGVIINAEKDNLIEVNLIKDVVKRLNQQKSINVKQEVIKSSDHFFNNNEIKVIEKVKAYFIKK